MARQASRGSPSERGVGYSQTGRRSPLFDVAGVSLVSGIMLGMGQGDVRETHLWWDGEQAHAYTERPADARKLERLLGAPDARIGKPGEARQTWRWMGKPASALVFNGRRRVSDTPAAKAAREAAGERLRKLHGSRGVSGVRGGRA